MWDFAKPSRCSAWFLLGNELSTNSKVKATVQQLCHAVSHMWVQHKIRRAISALPSLHPPPQLYPLLPTPLSPPSSPPGLGQAVHRWEDVVTIVAADMRQWEAPQQADILVSELLGSFGDNELSPECLDGAQKFLRKGGVSIPQSYTSFLQPITTAKLWNDVKVKQPLLPPQINPPSHSLFQSVSPPPITLSPPPSLTPIPTHTLAPALPYFGLGQREVWLNHDHRNSIPLEGHIQSKEQQINEIMCVQQSVKIELCQMLRHGVAAQKCVVPKMKHWKHHNAMHSAFVTCD